MQRANQSELYNAIEEESQTRYGTFDNNNNKTMMAEDAVDAEHHQ